MIRHISSATYGKCTEHVVGLRLQFRKWAQAERAMEAHNGNTRLPGADMPLVVKCAFVLLVRCIRQGLAYIQMQHNIIVSGFGSS